MKKKIFFIVASLGAGGSERVFWILSQGFNKKLYDVSVVFLDSSDKCFSMDIEDVDFIDLKTSKASLSFFKLLKLIKKEKPFAVFSTTDHINILVALVSLFVTIPNLIARASNIPKQMRHFDGLKAKFWNLFTQFSYKKFHVVVCQSKEMKEAIAEEFDIPDEKLVIIPNPVLYTGFIKEKITSSVQKKLIIVARLAKEKGFDRLLNIFKELPENYTLTIVGDGPLRTEIISNVKSLKIENRIFFSGQITEVNSLITKHDLMVLSSFTEGFPNVVLESLSVGIPVVTFRVGGVSGLIRNGFNGFIVEQDNLEDFKRQILKACSKKWDSLAIKEDVYQKCALDKVAVKYENLMA
ncbi:MAG: glycosyltransferase [Candidatus Pedobacter colombiensis]|uniref:Glycosyltransferase n=1 Tax=Candidatus Pedobacter colombiensis TaxID=3121371 RepID=A0AAJ5WD52_9SPHI|nr:glycosyltransferase [Pedobacter sp.]WEK21284.1 MAG: glycosyltransferase [Pedobacter sp.]